MDEDQKKLIEQGIERGKRVEQVMRMVGEAGSQDPNKVTLVVQGLLHVVSNATPKLNNAEVVVSLVTAIAAAIGNAVDTLPNMSEADGRGYKETMMHVAAMMLLRSAENCANTNWKSDAPSQSSEVGN